MKRSFWTAPWRLCLALLKQGMSPRKIALALALGISVSLCPIVGTTTVALTVLALWLRLNLPLVQAANYAALPLQWLMILPFIRLGTMLFGHGAVQVSATELAAMARTDTTAFLQQFWVIALHAAGAWLLCAPVLTAVLYWGFVRVLRKRGTAPTDHNQEELTTDHTD